MVDRIEHERCVDAWLAANVDDERDPRRVLDAVADAMRAIRVRSEASLGAGAASVIFERLVAKASGGFAALSGFSLDEPSSDVLGRFRRSDDVDRDDVLGASRELLVETLAVLASLTGDALTTALHGELAASAPRDRAPPAAALGSPSTRFVVRHAACTVAFCRSEMKRGTP